MCSAFQSVQVFSSLPCPNSPISSHFPRIAELQLLPQARQKASENFLRQPTFPEISVLPPEIGDCPQIMSAKFWRPPPPLSMWQQFYELAPQPLVSISIFKPIWQKAFQCYSRPDSKHLVLFSPKRRRSPSGNYDKVCSRQLVPDCPLAI